MSKFISNVFGSSFTNQKRRVLLQYNVEVNRDGKSDDKVIQLNEYLKGRKQMISFLLPKLLMGYKLSKLDRKHKVKNGSKINHEKVFKKKTKCNRISKQSRKINYAK